MALVKHLAPVLDKLLGSHMFKSGQAWKKKQWKIITRGVNAVGVAPQSEENLKQNLPRHQRKHQEENGVDHKGKAKNWGLHASFEMLKYEKTMVPYRHEETVTGLDKGFDILCNKRGKYIVFTSILDACSMLILSSPLQPCCMLAGGTPPPSEYNALLLNVTYRWPRSMFAQCWL